MDIICAGDLSISNAKRKSVVSFRMPPDPEHRDFVKEINEKLEVAERKATTAVKLKSFKKHHKKKH